MARKKPMLTIPVLDVQKQLDDDYRDQIEMLNLKIMDQDDANQFLKDRITRLEERDKDSQTRIESYQAAVVERSYSVARVTSMESDVRKLTADLKTEISNLATPGWLGYGGTVTTANGTNSITVTPPTGNLFFRLSSP